MCFTRVGGPVAVLAMLLAGAAGGFLYGQAVSGSLLGTVTDASGVVVHVFIAGQPAIDGLAKQIRQRKLGVLTAARIPQVLSHQIAEAQTLVQLANQNQAAVGGDSGSLEIDLQRSVQGELKGLVLFVTHGV
jgi:hypothetical protein